MDERVMRHWAASEAEAIGHGGIMIVHRATVSDARRPSCRACAGV